MLRSRGECNEIAKIRHLKHQATSCTTVNGAVRFIDMPLPEVNAIITHLIARRSIMPQCPACTAPGLEVSPDGRLTCSYCGSTLPGESIVCPACGHVNAYDVETCRSCGEPLSLLAQVMIRHEGRDQPYRLQQVRTQAPALKERESRESGKRMEVLQAIDQRRHAAEAEAKEAQEAYQRKISRIVLLIIPIFIVFIILLVVFIR